MIVAWSHKHVSIALHTHHACGPKGVILGLGEHIKYSFVYDQVWRYFELVVDEEIFIHHFQVKVLKFK